MSRPEAPYRFLAESERLRKATKLRGGAGAANGTAVATKSREGFAVATSGSATCRASTKSTAVTSDSGLDLGLQTYSQIHNTVPSQMAGLSAMHTSSGSAKKSGLSAPNGPSADELDRLRESIQSLVAEKEAIERAQLEQQDQLEKQRLSWTKERAMLVGGSGNSAADKIVQLSRKNRELTAEIAREKTHSAKLKTEVQELKGSLDALKASAAATKAPVDVQEAEKARLQTELSNMTAKMTDYRNQCQTLKQEVRVMHKVLTKELGDGADISKLTAQDKSGRGWRGRQQQITALQAKVSELQQALRTARASPEHGNEGTTQQSESQPASAASADHRQIEQLKKINKRKEKTAQETEAQLSQLRTANQDLQQRYDASRARCKTLTSQLKTMRGQIERLQSQSQQYDSMLSSLPSGSLVEVASPRGGELGADTRWVDIGGSDKLQELCKQQARDIHQLQCQVLKLQQDAGKEPDEPALKTSQKAASSMAHAGLKRSITSAPKVLSRLSVSQSSSRSTVSLPPISSDGLTGKRHGNSGADRPQSGGNVLRSSSAISKFATLSRQPGPSRPPPSTGVDSLKVERDHLRQLTAQLMEQNNSLTELPTDHRTPVSLDSPADAALLLTKLQCENKQLRNALSDSHRCKMTAFAEFKLVVDRLADSKRSDK